MDINSRVEQLIAKTANNKVAFSNATGISTVILSHISSGRNKVSLTAVEQILLAYPQVNSEWLISGKGSMFKETQDTREIDRIKQNLEELKIQLEQNTKSLESKIDAITALINNLTL